MVDGTDTAAAFGGLQALLCLPTSAYVLQRYKYGIRRINLRALARHLGCSKPEFSGASLDGAARAEAKKRVRTGRVKRMLKAELMLWF